MTEDFVRLAEKLMANETALSRLYQQFADTFPEDSAFWETISREELLHAAWIEKLLDVAGEGEIGTGSTTIRAVAVENSIKYIDSISAKCRQGNISRVNAYALAYDIENSLLEKKFLSVFAFGAGQYKKLSENLTDETRKHIEKIGEALKAIRSGRV